MEFSLSGIYSLVNIINTYSFMEFYKRVKSMFESIRTPNLSLNYGFIKIISFARNVHS